MKRAILGALVGIGLVMAAAAMAQQRGEVLPQRGAVAGPAPAAVAGTELIVVPTTLSDRVQMLTVVDARQRVLSVYHIDVATGKIALKSVRNIHWDMQIDHLNTDEPLPQAIRSMLEQK
jgi:predicted methyltransferase